MHSSGNDIIPAQVRSPKKNRVELLQQVFHNLNNLFTSTPSEHCRKN